MFNAVFDLLRLNFLSLYAMNIKEVFLIDYTNKNYQNGRNKIFTKKTVIFYIKKKVFLFEFIEIGSKIAQ